jgi:hypothetical protein
MTPRRHAPLALAALAALAAACQPDIPKRTNASTVEYALFNPSAEQIPLPNDIALQQFLASDPGPGVLPCSYFLPDTTTVGLCAFARAGGFPAPGVASPIEISFLTGTLQASGAIDFTPSPLDETTLGIAAAPLGGAAQPSPANLAVLDVTNPAAPGTVAVSASFDDLTGVLSVTPDAGTWTAGHKYVAVVRGGANGVLTTADVPYVAMPTLYVLRQAILSDRRLDLPENQGLLPGDAAEKAAAGAQLEQLRVGYAGVKTLLDGIAALTCPVANPLCLDIPFAELVSMQSFTIAPGGTVTIGEGTDPADASVTAGNTAPLDAFTVQSSVATATLLAVTVDLTDAGDAVAALTVNAAPDCAAATTLGLLNTAGGSGTKVIPLGVFPSATLTAATPLYVCATASANPGTVTGTVTAVTAFTGTGYTSAASGDAASATLTVNP